MTARKGQVMRPVGGGCSAGLSPRSPQLGYAIDALGMHTTSMADRSSVAVQDRKRSRPWSRQSHPSAPRAIVPGDCGENQ